MKILEDIMHTLLEQTLNKRFVEAEQLRESKDTQR